MVTINSALVALTSFNNFLVTPAGQKFALDAEAIVTDILKVLHVHLTPVPAPVPVVTAPKAPGA